MLMKERKHQLTMQYELAHHHNNGRNNATKNSTHCMHTMTERNWHR